MVPTNTIDTWLLEILRCPVSGLPLKLDGEDLVICDGFRRYAVVDGIPCLMPESAEPTHTGLSDAHLTVGRVSTPESIRLNEAGPPPD